MVCDVAIIDNEKTSIGKKKKKWQSKVNINKDKNGNGLKNIKYVWLWVYQDTLKNQFPLEDARQWIKKKTTGLWKGRERVRHFLYKLYLWVTEW